MGLFLIGFGIGLLAGVIAAFATGIVFAFASSWLENELPELELHEPKWEITYVCPRCGKGQS